MGECSEKQFVSVCVCARVFIFPGHVFFFMLQFPVQKNKFRTAQG